MDRPSDSDFERRWRDLTRVLGPLRRLRKLEGKDGSVRFGRGAIGKEVAIATCGLSLLGHGIELYVVPASARDVPFAEAFLAKTARETLADGPADWEALMREHQRAVIEMTGKVRGHDVVALVELGVGLAPRRLRRGVQLLALTSITRALAKRKVKGKPFFAVWDLEEVYDLMGRVRDPKNADASALRTASRRA